MIKRGLYTKHTEMHCRFWESQNNYVLQTDYSEELLSKGFKKYNDVELKNKVYKEVAFIDIESAFEVSTFCTYKGFKFFVESVLQTGIYVIRPLAETQIHFKDYERHGYDPVYEVEESEIEEVWEERKPIDEFLFDTEPVVYTRENKIVELLLYA